MTFGGWVKQLARNYRSFSVHHNKAVMKIDIETLILVVAVIQLIVDIFSILEKAEN